MVRVGYLVILLFFCFAIVIMYLTFLLRKRAVEEQAKIDRVLNEAKRALTLIESESADEILIGLQLLSVYDIGSIRIKAFPRLLELREHPDKQVAQLAQRIIKIAQSGEIEMALKKAI